MLFFTFVDYSLHGEVHMYVSSLKMKNLNFEESKQIWEFPASTYNSNKVQFKFMILLKFWINIWMLEKH